MSAENIILLSNIAWVVVLFVVGVMYLSCMIHASTLSENKAQIYFGTWYLNPKEFPTPEGKACCKRGAILVLVLTVMVVFRWFFWGDFALIVMHNFSS